MPLIPTIQTDVAAPQRANAGYRPALDRAERPTVQAGGIIEGIRGLVRSNEREQVDPSTFIEAAGAPAAAAAQVLTVVGQVAEKRIELGEQRVMLEADGAIDEENEAMATFMAKNPHNTAAWKAEAERRASDVQKRFADDPRLRKGAREKLGLRLQTWANTSKIHAEGQAARMEFGETRRMFDTRENDLIRTKRFGEAEELQKQKKATGLYRDYELDHSQTTISIGSSNEQMRQLDAEVNRLTGPGMRDLGGFDDARKLLSEHPKPPAVSDEDWQRGKDAMLNTINVNDDLETIGALMASDPAKLQDKLKNGTFKTLSERGKFELEKKAEAAREDAARQQLQDAKRALDLLPADKLNGVRPEALGVAMDQLTPWHRAVVEQDIAVRLGTASLDDEGQYLRDLAQVEQYTQESDPQRTAAARSELAFESRYSKSGPYYQLLMDKMKAKMDPEKAGLNPALEGAKASVFNTAEAASMKPILTPEGRALVRDAKVIGKTAGETKSFLGMDWAWPDSEATEVTENGGLPVPITRTDEVLLKANQAKAKLVSEQLERELANPETRKKWDADPPTLERRKLELMRAHGLPVVPSVLSGPSNALFPAGSYEEALKLAQ